MLVHCLNKLKKILMKIVNFITKNHLKTKRNYIGRMKNNKVEAMKIARKYDFDYWDGNRRYGYGGYNYIDGYWTSTAKKIIKFYNLNNNSSILDIGCGKGFLLFEIKKLLPGISVKGIDISRYSIKNAKNEIKSSLMVSDVRRYKIKKKFDLIISINCLHNLQIFELTNVIKKIVKNSRKSYIAIEGYKNIEELFNLQCWALTANTFFSKKEWQWFFKKNNYKGEFEIIYFN